MCVYLFRIILSVTVTKRKLYNSITNILHLNDFVSIYFLKTYSHRSVFLILQKGLVLQYLTNELFSPLFGDLSLTQFPAPQDLDSRKIVSSSGGLSF